MQHALQFTTSPSELGKLRRRGAAVRSPRALGPHHGGERADHGGSVGEPGPTEVSMGDSTRRKTVESMRGDREIPLLG